MELALETLTEIAGGGGVGIGVPPPPQAAANSTISGSNVPIQIVDLLTPALSIVHPLPDGDSFAILPIGKSSAQEERKKGPSHTFLRTLRNTEPSVLTLCNDAPVI
jgi:hypothetical protein